MKKKEMKNWDRMREKGGGEGEEGFPAPLCCLQEVQSNKQRGRRAMSAGVDGWQPSGRWNGTLGVNVERRPHRELAACWC